MKIPSKVAGLAALALASMFSLTTVTRAATHPLISPQGLAVASNGNLYVANSGGNNILVYSPNQTQLESETITGEIYTPESVAFDRYGNLWVANTGNSSITEYKPGGVQIIPNTITIGVSSPHVIAFDGLNELYVNNAYENVTVYEVPSGTTAVLGQNAFIMLLNTSDVFGNLTAFTGMASFGPNIVFGSNSNSLLNAPQSLLRGLARYSGELLPETCFSAAFDSTGNLYCANLDESLTIYPVGPFGNGKTLVANLGFVGFGVALDNTRGFVYISSQSKNSIAVYNTKGTLLKTIN